MPHGAPRSTAGVKATDVTFVVDQVETHSRPIRL